MINISLTNIIILLGLIFWAGKYLGYKYWYEFLVGNLD
jgi:hypothetical protein